MSRASLIEALILRASRFGDYHKQLLLLTPDTGLIKAVAFGACKGKSRLVSTSDPYSHARLHLYHNPMRDQYKITDIEVLESYEGVRSDLGRSYAAALMTELTEAAYAGGGPDYRYPFGLLRRCLGVLNEADGETAERSVFQFLLRFLIHAGFVHAGKECAQCDAPFAADAQAFFSSKDSELLCDGCAREGETGVSPGVRRYISAALEMPLSRALEIGLDRNLRGGLVRLLKELLESTLQSPVRSFDSFFSVRVL